MREIIKSERLNEEYVRIKHSSGLEMLLYPMKGFSTSYAMFATKYGSIDTTFKTDKDEDFISVPGGIAHFLEHKLFENEDGDAFSRYAKTGASANAYTSFDRTAYLFSCSDNFEQSLEILLDFVTKPYFTKETVEKEQGIIGQEIKMYDDNPDWRVFFNLLGALYHKNPIREDIAGTVDSIAKIDEKLLYRCYNTFYNLNNMLLVIAGNFNVDTVTALADKILKPAQATEIERAGVSEPRNVKEVRVVQYLPVSLPLFQMGFKGDVLDEKTNINNTILDEIITEIIAGESTPVYRRLYDAGLINSTFSGEVLAGRDYICAIYSGESRSPDKVYAEICSEIKYIKSKGIEAQIFEINKKAVYGRYIGMFGKTEAVAGAMMAAHFSGVSIYDLLEIVANTTLEEIESRLRDSFDVSRSSLSIVSSPKETEE